MNIVFIIRSLDLGGAERQLIQLASTLDKKQFKVSIVTYYKSASDYEIVSKLLTDIPVFCANKRGRFDIFGFVLRVISLVRPLRPHIVHGYMWGANELASILGFVCKCKVVWGVRASNINFSKYDPLFNLLKWTGIFFSKTADLIISNSESGKLHHVELGYDRDKITVIPNGIDTSTFKRDPLKRLAFRREAGLPFEATVIGIVGRLDPMKGHDVFFEAIAQCVQKKVNAYYLVVGTGPAKFEKTLRQKVGSLRLDSKVFWAGFQEDMTAVYSSLDVLVSASSFGEGFSNVLGEAMACGVICISTDVGDARKIIGEEGIVVPPDNSCALARAIETAVELDGEDHGRRARLRVAHLYSCDQLIKSTSSAFIDVVLSHRRAG